MKKVKRSKQVNKVEKGQKFKKKSTFKIVRKGHVADCRVSEFGNLRKLFIFTVAKASHDALNYFNKA